MRRISFRGFAVASCLALAAASPARATWVPDGTPLWPGHATDINWGSPDAVADGRGGFFVSRTWHRWRGGSDTTFFRFAADGTPAIGWPIRTPTGLFSVSSLAPDGEGGAYFAASVGNWPSEDQDVRAFHLRPDGEYDPAFGPGGILVGVASNPGIPQVAPDGDGGAIVTWTEGDSQLGNELHGSRVTSLGLITPGWPATGVFITSVTYPPDFIACGPPIADGAGGFFQYIERTSLFPTNQRSPNLLHYDGIGQMVAGWPSQGFALTGQFGFSPDGSGGVYVTQGYPSNILHVTSSGASWPGWPAGGLDPCPNPSLGCFTSGLLADGEGGVGLTLQRQLNSPSDPYDLHLVRLDSGGGLHPGWAPGGVLLPSASSTQAPAIAMAHGPGAAWVLLYGRPASSDNAWDILDLHAARVEPGGELFRLGAWSAGEIPVCTAPGVRFYPQLVEAPGGAVFAVWLDSRGGYDSMRSLYAMRISPDGGVSTGVTPGAPGESPLTVAPNPMRVAAEVRFAMRERASVEIAVFDVTGRRVRTLASGTREAGDQRLAWDGRDAAGRMTRPGVYLVRATIGGRASEAPLVRLD